MAGFVPCFRFAGRLFTDATKPPLTDANLLIFPCDASIGAIGDFGKQSRTAEIAELKSKRELNVWEVRVLVSDSVPLAGDAEAALSRPCDHLFLLIQSPLFIYLHEGGHKATYYELVAEERRETAREPGKLARQCAFRSA